MTWFILASGPSMLLQDANAVRGRGTVVAINNTVQLAPWADVLYSCDPSWWRQNPKLWQGFKGRKVGLNCHNWDASWGVELLQPDEGDGKGIRPMHNSGAQAIQLAAREGARTIVLLGFDMQYTYGMRHWHGDHKAGLGNFGCVDLCRDAMPALAHDLRQAGIRCINATRETSLRCFERMPLKDALVL